MQVGKGIRTLDQPGTLKEQQLPHTTTPPRPVSGASSQRLTASDDLPPRRRLERGHCGDHQSDQERGH